MYLIFCLFSIYEKCELRPALLYSAVSVWIALLHDMPKALIRRLPEASGSYKASFTERNRQEPQVFPALQRC